MKIVFLDAKTLGDDVELNIFNKLGDFTSYPTTSGADVISRLQDADIAIVNKINMSREVMENLPRLKLICEAATGTDNIDLKAAESLNILVKNVVGYSTNSVVQHTFSMLFYFLNNMNYYKEYSSSGEWIKSDTFAHFNTFADLANLKFGIIGLGRIGSSVGNVANAFGCDVQYFSTSGQNCNPNFAQVSLDSLLKTSDIISIHAPLNENTLDLISTQELSLCKDEAIILNLGRGGIINETAMAQYIKKSQIRFGVDVLTKEPMSIDSPLNEVRGACNLLLTPHIGWASKDAREILIKNIYSHIEAFISK